MRRSPGRTRQLLASLGTPVMRGTVWKKLTRADLSHFDDIPAEIVLIAMDRGGIGRISTGGHATIRHPDGVSTMSVSRHGTGRKAENMRNDLQRLFPLPQNGSTQNGNQEMEAPKFTDIELATRPAPADEELLKCPAGMPAKRACDKEFATEGALYSHIRDDHDTCDWKGPDVEHDDPNYTCDLNDGAAFVGNSKQATAGHVNIYHKGNKPWEKRDNSYEARSRAAKKGAETRALHRTPVAEPAAELPSTANTTTTGGPTTVIMTPSTLPPVKKLAESKDPDGHRGLPPGAVAHKPVTDKAILAAIRELLGEDPQVAKLKKEVADLQAQLDLIAEALHVNAPAKKKK